MVVPHIKHLSVAVMVIGMLCSCASQQPARVHTYADLEAETWGAAVRYQCSQLTSRQQQNLDCSSLSSHLFFELPLTERVLFIMASFAKVDLDGEEAERMDAMLHNRGKEPSAWWEYPYPPSSADLAYTNSIFRTIDGFTDRQVRAFCSGSGDYVRFRKNLKRWKEHCNYVPSRHS